MNKSIKHGFDRDCKNLRKYIHANYNDGELIDFEGEQRKRMLQ